MTEECANCRFFRTSPYTAGGYCHRYAPRSSGAAAEALAQALITIAWVLAKHTKQTDEPGELLDAERSPYERPAFPRMERDDWCGEWSPA